MTAHTNDTNFYRLMVIIASLVIVIAGLAMAASLAARVSSERL